MKRNFCRGCLERALEVFTHEGCLSCDSLTRRQISKLPFCCQKFREMSPNRQKKVHPRKGPSKSEAYGEVFMQRDTLKVFIHEGHLSRLSLTRRCTPAKSQSVARHPGRPFQRRALVHDKRVQERKRSFKCEAFGKTSLQMPQAYFRRVAAHGRRPVM